MDSVLIPTINGILPRPEGGTLTGLFMEKFFLEMLSRLKIGEEVLLAPFLPADSAFYPMGVLARIENMEKALFPGPGGAGMPAVFVQFSGRGRMLMETVQVMDGMPVARGLRPVSLQALRRENPAICGGGWQPQGGYTDTRSPGDTTITIYGVDIENGKKVSITGRVGGILQPAEAHTVEHAIIRSLQTFGLCSAKTLRAMIADETRELKTSLEMGIRLELPEIFGRTQSGVCGNPLTNLTQFYLAREIMEGLKRGESFPHTLEAARRKTLSQIARNLEITTDPRLRALQGLKKGMMHTDEEPELKRLKKVLAGFPVSPWE